MSDFYIHTGVNRDTLAEALRENDEQVVYVIVSALTGGPVEDAIDYMSLPSDFSNEDRDQVVANLMDIATALLKEDCDEVPF